MKLWLKRWQAVLLSCILAATGSGCGQEPSVPVPPETVLEQQFCQVSMAGTEISGQYSRSLEGQSVFVVETPEEIAGMQVHRSETEYTVTVTGLSVKRSGEAMEQSLFGRVFTALDALENSVWNNGSWTASLSDGTDITARTQETGQITVITVPLWQLTIRFPEKR